MIKVYRSTSCPLSLTVKTYPARMFSLLRVLPTKAALDHRRPRRRRVPNGSMYLINKVFLGFSRNRSEKHHISRMSSTYMSFPHCAETSPELGFMIHTVYLSIGPILPASFKMSYSSKVLWKKL